jgi:SHS2 domain-containing protein
LQWKVISHTADHAFRVYGKDFNELLHNALIALLESFFGEIPESHSGNQQLQIRIARSDPAVMIIDFLREVHYQIVAEHNIPLNIKIIDLNKSELVIELTFKQEIELIPKLIDIKAVTYHNIKIAKTGSGLFLDVICDV